MTDQRDLFGPTPPGSPIPATPASKAPAALAPRRLRRTPTDSTLVDVEPASCNAGLQALAGALPPTVHLGTSSWNFPGWTGMVWAGEHPAPVLSRHGLGAYARHPLLNTVSLDRAFYRPLDVDQYAAYAAQVPDGFRFVVKAPSLVTDAVVRSSSGRAERDNASFLDGDLALSTFVRPALEGLGEKLGALVFQFSPLPQKLVRDDAAVDALLHRVAALLVAADAPALASRAVVVAIEVRNRELVRPELASMLKTVGATYCLGVHPRLPSVDEQMPMLRALWPGPFVCRWNLNSIHGPHGYEEAREHYRPFNRIVDPDPATRDAIARIVAGTASAGFATYVTVNNKAEGSAPLSIAALAERIAARVSSRSTEAETPPSVSITPAKTTPSAP